MAVKWKRCNWAQSIGSSLRSPLFMGGVWRITYLMRLSRNCPDLNAALFSADEICGTYLPAKQPRSAQPPRSNEVIRLIAKIGGFLGRKSDHAN